MYRPSRGSAVFGRGKGNKTYSDQVRWKIPLFSQAAVVYTCTTSCRAHVLHLISNQGAPVIVKKRFQSKILQVEQCSFVLGNPECSKVHLRLPLQVTIISIRFHLDLQWHFAFFLLPHLGRFPFSIKFQVGWGTWLEMTRLNLNFPILQICQEQLYVDAEKNILSYPGA